MADGPADPDLKTIADFRKDNGAAIRATCRHFVLLCREFDLLSEASVAVDGSKFKAVNARERNYTPNVVRRRMEQVEASVQRLSCTRFPWTAICPTGGRHDEIHHERDRKR